MEKPKSMVFSRPARIYERNFRLILFAAIAALLLLAWHHRFIQDDAFISFRYADNLVRGWGLVWNEGERIEGYTNFLWTMLIAAALAAHLDAVTSSMALGLASFIASVYFTYRLAFLVLQSKSASLVTILMLGTNYTFSCYATGGMETQLQTSLFVATLYLLVDAYEKKLWTKRRLAAISLLLSLALLTRLDSAILFAVVFPSAFFPIIRERGVRPSQRAAKVASLCAPLLVIIGVWFLWKLHYYGDIFPNTFYAKVNSLNSYYGGLLYIYYFFRSYWLFPLLLIPLFAARRIRARLRPGLIFCLAATVLWLLYVVSVGGDFMEFRFIVPVMPFIFVIICWMVFALIRNHALRAACMALVIAGSVYHGMTFVLTGDVEAIPALQWHVREGEHWEAMGKVLGRAFNYDPRVTIAVTASGAIPFYSRLTTIDMMGLNDRWIARNGYVVGYRPGHQRAATLEYLLSRDVNLLLGQARPMSREIATPTYGDLQSAFVSFSLPVSPEYNVPETSRLIEIPITPELKMTALYLMPNPLVDDAIRREGWRTHKLVGSDADPSTWPEEFPEYGLGTRIVFNSVLAERYLWGGWSAPEPLGRWSDSQQAMLIFGLRQGPTSDMVLRAKILPFIWPGKLDAQRVTVSLNGKVVANLRLTNREPQEFTLGLPRDALGTKNVLSFKMPDAVSPQSIGALAYEIRRLGISVEWMEIDPRH